MNECNISTTLCIKRQQISFIYILPIIVRCKIRNVIVVANKYNESEGVGPLWVTKTALHLGINCTSLWNHNGLINVVLTSELIEMC